MKKVLLVISLVFLLTGCGSKLTNNYTVDIKNSKKCNNEAKEYYKDGDTKVYLVCIDKITLKDGNKKVSLKKYLKDKDNSIEKVTDELIKKVVKESSLLDGTAIIYRDGGTIKYSNNGYTIIKCKTSDNNNDVYIGTEDLDINKGFANGFCGHTENDNQE